MTLLAVESKKFRRKDQQSFRHQRSQVIKENARSVKNVSKLKQKRRKTKQWYNHLLLQVVDPHRLLQTRVMYLHLREGETFHHRLEAIFHLPLGEGMYHHRLVREIYHHLKQGV